MIKFQTLSITQVNPEIFLIKQKSSSFIADECVLFVVKAFLKN